MDSTEGNLRALLNGGSQLKTRVQHPEVHERKDRGEYYWFFRYRKDEIQPDGTVRTTRAFKTLGPSKGKDAWTITKAREERDKFLADLNKATTTVQAAMQPNPEDTPTDPGEFKFGPLAEMWKRDYVDKVAAGKHLIAVGTRTKYTWALGYILPKWKDARLKDLKAKDVMDWLQEVSTSGHGVGDHSALIREPDEVGEAPEEVGGVREAHPLSGGDGAGARATGRAEPADLRNLPRYRDAHFRSAGADDQACRSEERNHPDRPAQLPWRHRRAQNRREQAHPHAGRVDPALPEVDRQPEAQGAERLGLPAGGGSQPAPLGLWRPQGTEGCGVVDPRGRRARRGYRTRLSRLRPALPAPREHHVAAGRGRQQHRSQQDRGPLEGVHDARLHHRRNSTAGRVDAQDPGEARQGCGGDG